MQRVAPHVYDKAKYHEDSVLALGLPRVQAFVHTGMYVGWLFDRDLIAADVRSSIRVFAFLFRIRLMSPISLYRICDGCLTSDMLTSVGDAFSRRYFDFDDGRYLSDYRQLFALAEADEFSLRFSWRAYNALADLLDNRFADWSANRATA